MTIGNGDLADTKPLGRLPGSIQARDSGGTPFQIETNRDGGQILVRLSGSLDHRASHQFDRVGSALTREGASEVVLDLHRLSYMDTTGQRELLLFWRRSRSEHFNLSLIGVSRDLRERMRITGVDKLLRLA